MIGAVVTVFGIRAFQPPVPLGRLETVKPGMSETQLREVLGSPTHVYHHGVVFTMHGTNFAQTGGAWMYHRFLTFGYITVVFDTNSKVSTAAWYQQCPYLGIQEKWSLEIKRSDDLLRDRQSKFVTNGTAAGSTR